MGQFLGCKAANSEQQNAPFQSLLAFQEYQAERQREASPVRHRSVGPPLHKDLPHVTFLRGPFQSGRIVSQREGLERDAEEFEI